MAASFGPDTPVLDYGPRAHADPGRRNDRVWLGWPAWAFRVVAPKLRSTRLNALQKAVLGVLRASKLTAAELGNRLGIHRELAAFVVADLRESACVDSKWAVTETGIGLLEEEQAESAELVPGWVFRDGLSERLLPFVAPALEYARMLAGDGPFRSLDLGTTGSPWRQTFWRISQSEDSRPDDPKSEEILRAARQSRRLDQRWQRVGTHEDENDRAVPGVVLDRLRSIDPAPQPVFLVTYLYTPRGQDGDGDWYACEFFGRGYDSALRPLVIDAAQREQKLAQLLDKRLFDGTRYGSSAAFQKAAADRQAWSRRLLATVLTIGIENHSVAPPLREMLEAYLEWRELADRRRARNVLTECRRTLESLFAGVGEEHRLDGVWRKLTREDAALNTLKLQAAAKQIGLDTLPDAMLRVRQGLVRAASDHHDAWRLRPLTMATLLRAKDDPKHPLAKAATLDTAVLGRVERVAALGGKAAHESDGAELGETLDQVVQDTLDICGLLLDLPTKPLKELMSDG